MLSRFRRVQDLGVEHVWALRGVPWPAGRIDARTVCRGHDLSDPESLSQSVLGTLRLHDDRVFDRHLLRRLDAEELVDSISDRDEPINVLVFKSESLVVHRLNTAQLTFQFLCRSTIDLSTRLPGLGQVFGERQNLMVEVNTASGQNDSFEELVALKGFLKLQLPQVFPGCCSFSKRFTNQKPHFAFRHTQFSADCPRSQALLAQFQHICLLDLPNLIVDCPHTGTWSDIIIVPDFTPGHLKDHLCERAPGNRLTDSILYNDVTCESIRKIDIPCAKIWTIIILRWDFRQSYPTRKENDMTMNDRLHVAVTMLLYFTFGLLAVLSRRK